MCFASYFNYFKMSIYLYMHNHTYIYIYIVACINVYIYKVISHLLHGMSWYNHAIPSKKISGTWDFGFIELKGHVHHHFPPKPFTAWWFLLYNIYIHCMCVCIYIYYIYMYIYICMFGGFNPAKKYESELG